MTTDMFRWDNPPVLSDWRSEPLPNAAGMTLHGPVVALPDGCAEIVSSWSAETPPDAWIELELRVQVDEVWSEYQIARWDGAASASRRTSFATQRDAYGHVATDTLCLDVSATAVQAVVRLYGTSLTTPQVHSIALACSSRYQPRTHAGLPGEIRELVLPVYSQYAYVGGEGWCSPTSLAMVLGYWHGVINNNVLAPFADASSVEDRVVPQVYDPTYDGHGNWSFNVAYAATLGLEAFVTRMDCFEQVARWVAAGVPVIASVSWKEGQLTGAPATSSAGHLLVITGFTAAGDVVVADPAGANATAVRRVYAARELFACWLRACGGTVYLIYPGGWHVPSARPGDGW